MLLAQTTIVAQSWWEVGRSNLQSSIWLPCRFPRNNPAGFRLIVGTLSPATQPFIPNYQASSPMFPVDGIDALSVLWLIPNQQIVYRSCSYQGSAGFRSPTLVLLAAYSWSWHPSIVETSQTYQSTSLSQDSIRDDLPCRSRFSELSISRLRN